MSHAMQLKFVVSIAMLSTNVQKGRLPAVSCGGGSWASRPSPNCSLVLASIMPGFVADYPSADKPLAASGDSPNGSRSARPGA